jgi:hypothetical protein
VVSRGGVLQPHDLQVPIGTADGGIDVGQVVGRAGADQFGLPLALDYYSRKSSTGATIP